MAGRSRCLAAQERRHMPNRRVKRRRGVNNLTFPRRKSSRIQNVYADKKKNCTIQTDAKQRTEQIAPANTLHRRTVDPFPKPSDIQQPKARKRKREDEHIASRKPCQAVERARISTASVSRPVGPEAINSESSYISYWAKEGNWPSAYFEGDIMNHLLARKPSTASLSRKRSNPSIAGSSASDERLREEKSAPYRNQSYHTLLSEDVDNYKSYMKDHKEGISKTSEMLLEILLNSKQSPPIDGLFGDKVFPKFLEKLEGKNESKIIQDLSPLLVPSVETLALLGHCSAENLGEVVHKLYPHLFPSIEAATTFGADHLSKIVESVNEGWNDCHPITKTRPQPDSAFAYGVPAFSDDQIKVLRPTIGPAGFRSYFKGTYYMLFPFLTKEVKTGFMGLEIAQNQNLHSMTIAVRAVVELFKYVGREMELHREIVAFSVSHDDTSVRIYAHYPYIDGEKVSIWRRSVKQFFLDQDNKWTCYTFTTNVYDIFSLIHLKRICIAIDDTHSGQLVAQNSESHQQSDDRVLTTGTSGLSQQLADQRWNDDPVILDGQPDSQQATPNTSIENYIQSPKRKKKKGEGRSTQYSFHSLEILR